MILKVSLSYEFGMPSSFGDFEAINKPTDKTEEQYEIRK